MAGGTGNAVRMRHGSWQASTAGSAMHVDQAAPAVAHRQYGGCTMARALARAGKCSEALQLARGDHGLDPVAYVQCAEDRREVDLHRALADAEVPRDQLVGLALRQQ